MKTRSNKQGIKISIITPVYNGESFIESCLENVINQNCPHAEHLVIDGDSSDRTMEITRHYAEVYSHIRYLSETDAGQSDAMNKGIELANGNIISILNSDDFYEPNTLNRVLEIFNDLHEPSLLVGNCKVWNDKGQLMTVNKPSKMSFLDILMGWDINPMPVNPSAYFYHKVLHEKVGLYPVEEHHVMDWDFILKAVQVAHIKYYDEDWGNFRYIEGTKTFEGMTNNELKKRVDILFKKHVNSLGWFKKSIFKFKILMWPMLQKSLIRAKYFSRYPSDLPSSMSRKVQKFLHRN